MKGEKVETMEQVFKHSVESKRTDRYEEVKSNLWGGSNAITSFDDVVKDGSTFFSRFLNKKPATMTVVTGKH
ncbi:hypothetical protein [Lactobacillus crispatus]|uniref:hypothetical protein n=2 Tax=Lactobacillus crispatus TaxID=47770 RepID=UPI002551AE7E|nr:hypothetical protein [Lactobacillus crispatus]